MPSFSSKKSCDSYLASLMFFKCFTFHKLVWELKVLIVIFTSTHPQKKNKPLHNHRTGIPPEPRPHHWQQTQDEFRGVFWVFLRRQKCNKQLESWGTVMFQIPAISVMIEAAHRGQRWSAEGARRALVGVPLHLHAQICLFIYLF